MPTTYNLNEITLVKATELQEVAELGEGKVIFSISDDLFRFDLSLITNQAAEVAGGWKGNVVPFQFVTEDGIYTPIEAGTYGGFGHLVYDPEGEDVGYLVQFIKYGQDYFKRRTKLALPTGYITGELGRNTYPEITF